MRTCLLLRPTSALVVALASFGAACAGSDATATTAAPAPITTPAGTEATAATTTTTARIEPSTVPPSTAADTIETPVSADTLAPADLLAAFDPPAELGTGFTRVEGEGAPPPAAAWTAMEATGDCAGVEPLWNVASTDKLAARNIQYLGASPTDLRGLVVFVLTPEGASTAWQWMAGAPAQVATCWQEGVRVLTGISDFTIVDAGGPTDPVPSSSIVWRHQTVGSATFAFESTQAFGMIRHGDVVAWVSLAGATDDAEVAAILGDVDSRVAGIAG